MMNLIAEYHDFQSAQLKDFERAAESVALQVHLKQLK